MRPLRLLISLASSVLAIIILVYVGVPEASDSRDGDDDDSRNDAGPSKGGLGGFFSFHGPLFPPSAIISLTDDNSTFFLSRPAAFGVKLPQKGLSGRLWIGHGFNDEGKDSWHPYTQAEGELGCSDASEQIDLYDAIPKRSTLRRRDYDAASRISDALHEDGTTINDDQASDLKGKIALLSRGGCGFLDKVQWAQNRGAVAVIVGDTVRGGPIITMYARGDTSNISIPALFTTRTTAHLLSTLVDASNAGRAFHTEQDAHNDYHKSTGWSGFLKVKHRIIAKQGKLWTAAVTSKLGMALSRKASDTTREHGQTDHVHSAHARETASWSDSLPHQTRHVSHAWATRHGDLWITLTPTTMSSNPFLDTLLVLVVSPLITLTVVYALLVLRARVQRRRWRAPKSVVERLPVRTYRTLPSSSSQVATPMSSSPTTPLLSSFPAVEPKNIASSQAIDAAPAGGSSADGIEAAEEPSNHDAVSSGLDEWRRKYGGRQKECVVCLEEYVDGVSRVMGLPCGHEFHAECITPWLTRRRRTCPICKGDVVRSLARNARSHQSPSPPRGLFGQRPSGRAREASYSSSSSGDESLTDFFEDVQTQAAVRRNDSPSAAIPIPTDGNDADLEGLHDGDDLEGGIDVSSMPEGRGRAGRTNIWRRVGSLGIPSFLTGIMSRSPNQREDRRTR